MLLAQFRGVDIGEPDLFAGVGGAGIAVVTAGIEHAVHGVSRRTERQGEERDE